MNGRYITNSHLEIHDLGLRPFIEIHDLQRSWLEKRIRDEIPDRLLLVQHPPVFTLGRKFQAKNLLHPGEIPVIPVARGGDISFHEPGQLVAYPILKLTQQRRDIGWFLRGLEEVLIQTLAEFKLVGERDQRNTGVWINGLKIASIGIAIRRWVTWHGLALNVNNSLEIAQRIHPCGFPADIITSMQCQSTVPIVYDAVKAQLIQSFRHWWSDHD